MTVASMEKFPSLFDFLLYCGIFPSVMTAYGQHITKDKSTPLLSHNSVNEAKEARRKILEAIFQRRRENYKRFMQKKRQLQADVEVL